MSWSLLIFILIWVFGDTLLCVCCTKWTERCTGIRMFANHQSNQPLCLSLYGDAFVGAHDPVGIKPSKRCQLQKHSYFALVYNCLNEKEIISPAFCKQ